MTAAIALTEAIAAVLLCICLAECNKCVTFAIVYSDETKD